MMMMNIEYTYRLNNIFLIVLTPMNGFIYGKPLRVCVYLNNSDKPHPQLNAISTSIQSNTHLHHRIQMLKKKKQNNNTFELRSGITGLNCGFLKN